MGSEETPALPRTGGTGFFIVCECNPPLRGTPSPPCPGVWSAATNAGVRNQGAQRPALRQPLPEEILGCRERSGGRGGGGTGEGGCWASPGQAAASRLGASGNGAGDVAACQPQGKAAEAAASGSQPLGAGFDVPAAAGVDEPVDDQHPQGVLRSRPGQYQGPPGVAEEVAHAARCGPGVVEGLGGRVGGQAVLAGGCGRASARGRCGGGGQGCPERRRAVVSALGGIGRGG